MGDHSRGDQFHQEWPRHLRPTSHTPNRQGDFCKRVAAVAAGNTLQDAFAGLFGAHSIAPAKPKQPPKDSLLHDTQGDGALGTGTGTGATSTATADLSAKIAAKEKRLAELRESGDFPTFRERMANPALLAEASGAAAGLRQRQALQESLARSGVQQSRASFRQRMALPEAGLSATGNLIEEVAPTAVPGNRPATPASFRTRMTAR